MTYPILYEINQYIHQIYDVKTPKKKNKLNYKFLYSFNFIISPIICKILLIFSSKIIKAYITIYECMCIFIFSCYKKSKIKKKSWETSISLSSSFSIKVGIIICVTVITDDSSGACPRWSQNPSDSLKKNLILIIIIIAAKT